MLLLVACGQEQPSSAGQDTRGAPDVQSDAPLHVRDTSGSDAGASDVVARDTDDLDSSTEPNLGDASSGDSTPSDVHVEDATFDVGPEGIAFVRPASGSRANNHFGFEVVVADPEATVVTFSVNGTVIREDTAPPFAAIWDVSDIPDGPYEVQAIARSGNDERSASLPVFVDRTGPVIRFVEPGGSVHGPIDGRLPFDLEVEDAAGIWEVRVEAMDQQRVLRVPPFVGEFTLPPESAPSLRIDAIAFDRLGNASRAGLAIAYCPEDHVRCRGVCTPVRVFETSAAHCGGCGLACDLGREICEDARCTCAEGLTSCGEDCANLDADPAHCGGCDMACSGTEECIAGTCRPNDGSNTVAVLPGAFPLGPRPGELGYNWEVEFSLDATLTRPYAVDRTEVTHAEWESYFDVNPSYFWSCGSDCPVESVTWFDALAFANARSRAESLRPCYDLSDCNDLPPGAGFYCFSVGVTARSGNPLDCSGYRLPTEAEWEVAYRAGTVTSTYAGELFGLSCESTDQLGAIAWFACNSAGTPHPVGTRAPNAFGLYDMAGNVFEWTWDVWRTTAGPDAAETDPLGGPPGSSGEHAIRGGSWNERAERQRASTRLSAGPSEALSFVGFRLVRTLDEDEL